MDRAAVHLSLAIGLVMQSWSVFLQALEDFGILCRDLLPY